MFTDEQVAALRAKLDPSHVSQRNQAGRSLSYIEGWHAIAEANRIFGFDAWSRQTVDIRMVSERERKIGRDQKPGWSVTYTAQCRIQIGDVIREGVGAGHGIDQDLGQAHESAIKEAETDAMKRALMTFGNPFGLALYDKTQANVGREAPQANAPKSGQSASPALERCQNALLGAAGVADVAEAERLSDEEATLAFGRLRDQVKNTSNSPDYKGLSKDDKELVNALAGDLKKALERIPAK